MRIRVQNNQAEVDLDGLVIATATQGTVTMGDKRLKLTFIAQQAHFEWYQQFAEGGEYVSQGQFQTPSESWVTVEDFV